MKYTMIVHMKNTGAAVKQDGCEIPDEYLDTRKFLQQGGWLRLLGKDGSSIYVDIEDINRVQLIPESQPTGDTHAETNSR